MHHLQGVARFVSYQYIYIIRCGTQTNASMNAPAIQMPSDTISNNTNPAEMLDTHLLPFR
jgi:hypothetical protein